MVVGFASNAPNRAFSAGPILLTFLPAKSAGTKSLLLTAPAPIYILKCPEPKIVIPCLSLKTFFNSAYVFVPSKPCIAPGVVNLPAPLITLA